MTMQQFNPGSSFGVYSGLETSTSSISFSSIAIDSDGYSYINGINSRARSLDFIVLDDEDRIVTSSSMGISGVFGANDTTYIQGSTIISGDRVYNTGIFNDRIYINGRNRVKRGNPQQSIVWLAASGYVTTGTSIYRESPILISTASNRLTLVHPVRSGGQDSIYSVISELAVNPSTGQYSLIDSKISGYGEVITDIKWDGQHYYAIGIKSNSGSVPISFVTKMTASFTQVQGCTFYNSGNWGIECLQLHLLDQDLVLVFRGREASGSQADQIQVTVQPKNLTDNPSSRRIVPQSNRRYFPSSSIMLGTSTIAIQVVDITNNRANDLVEWNFEPTQFSFSQRQISNILYTQYFPRQTAGITGPVDRALNHMILDNDQNIVYVGQLSNGSPLNQEVGYRIKLGSTWKNVVSESGDVRVSAASAVDTLTAGNSLETIPGFLKLVSGGVTTSPFAALSIVSTSLRGTSGIYQYEETKLSLQNSNPVTYIPAIPLTRNRPISLLDIKSQYQFNLATTPSYVGLLTQTANPAYDPNSQTYQLTFPKALFVDTDNGQLNFVTETYTANRQDYVVKMTDALTVISTGRPAGNISGVSYAWLKAPFATDYAFALYTFDAQNIRLELIHPSNSSFNQPVYQLSVPAGRGITPFIVYPGSDQTQSTYFFRIIGRTSGATTPNGDYSFIAVGNRTDFGTKNIAIRFFSADALPAGPYTGGYFGIDVITKGSLTSSLTDVICGSHAITSASPKMLVIHYNFDSNTVLAKSRITVNTTVLNGSSLISFAPTINDIKEFSGGYFVSGYFRTSTSDFGTYAFVVKYNSSFVPIWYKIFQSKRVFNPGFIKIGAPVDGSNNFYLSYTDGIAKIDATTGAVLAAKRLTLNTPFFNTNIYDIVRAYPDTLYISFKANDTARQGIIRLNFDFENFNEDFVARSEFSLSSDPYFREVTDITLSFDSAFTPQFFGLSGPISAGDYTLSSAPAIDAIIENKTLLTPSDLTTSNVPIPFSDYFSGGAASNRVPAGTTGRFNNITYTIPSSGTLDMFKYYESPSFYTFVITENVSNTLTISNALITGWDQESPVRVVIPTGIVISSNNAAFPALVVTDIWPNGILIENYGYIVGMGGKGGDRTQTGFAGGTAIRASVPITLDNYGTIAGGGGGGGAGALISPPNILSNNGADSAPGSGGASGLTAAQGGTTPTQPYGNIDGYISRNLVTDQEILTSILEPGPNASTFYSDLDNYYWEANLDGTGNLLVFNGQTVDDETFIDTSELQWPVTLNGYVYYRNISSGFVDIDGRRVWRIRRVSGGDPVFESPGQYNVRIIAPGDGNFYYSSTGGQGGAWGVAGDTGSRQFTGYFEYNYQGYAGGAGGFAVDLVDTGRVIWKNQGKIFGRYYNGLTLRNNPRLISSVREPTTGFNYSPPNYIWRANNFSNWLTETFSVSAAGVPNATTWSQGDYTYLRGPVVDSGNGLYQIARISISKYNQP